MYASPSPAKEGRDCCEVPQHVECSTPEDFLCPICLEVISEATWLVHTRQLFDRSCLIHWLEHGGRTCPATGLPLPAQVRMRAAPDLQAAIHVWAAKYGLEVPSSLTLGRIPCGVEGPVKHPKFLARLLQRLKKLLAQIHKFMEDSPKLYPALDDANWAHRL